MNTGTQKGGTLVFLGFRIYLEVTRDLLEEIEATSVWFFGVLTVAAVLALILVFA